MSTPVTIDSKGDRLVALPPVTSIPLFVRKFIVDFVETAIGAIFLLNIAFPQSVADSTKVFTTLGVAITGALVSALRRIAPDFLKWLREKLYVGG